MINLRLNLGCGARRIDGYINVDKFGDPDLRFDLETFPYPWQDNSVIEIEMHHVLEHLGQQTETYSGSQQHRGHLKSCTSSQIRLLKIDVPHQPANRCIQQFRLLVGTPDWLTDL